jgi:hypothetical protein
VRIESIKSDIKNYFFLTVDGDSMSGIGIFHKSLVLVHKQETVNNNEVAVVMANGDEATVKRVRFIENEMVMLIPENNAFSPQFYHRNDIHICGKVDGTSGIITWVKGLGWFLGIICFIAGFSFINDNKSPEIGFLLLINGVILIISGVYLGGIIYLFQQQIKRQNEIIHSIKELNEK